MIELKSALRLGAAPQIAFVGAGGKSAALFTLARQFDKPVLVTTSTHLATSQAQLADLHLTFRQPGDVKSLDVGNLPSVTVITGETTNKDRLGSLDESTLGELSALARQHGLPLLIEADGARQRALKAPAEHEPVIPDFVDSVVVVVGFAALGQPLSEALVHRPERFAELSSLKLGAPLDARALVRVLSHSQGGLKNIPQGARRIVLLNQADTPELQAAAHGLAVSLLAMFDAVLVAALQSSPEVSAVHEPIAGILLAAGSSERLGKPKQLLDWKGKPFVRHIAETALSARLSPLVVVTGAEAENVEAALSGLNVVIVRNRSWQAGQSSSVKVGLAALPPKVGAALFLVVDQPQLSVALIEALRAQHSVSLAPIVAPQVDGHRSNPVLFDRSTFPDFLGLQGEVGGRAIFSKHPVTWLPWLDASMAIDVDRPEDYERLLRQAGQAASE